MPLSLKRNRNNRRSTKKTRNSLNRRSTKRTRNSFNRRVAKRSFRGGNEETPSFAAKLAAFILEGLGEEEPNIGHGDDQMQPKVKGALPYLHMNIQEEDVVNKFKETEQMRIDGLAKLCNDKYDLDKKLEKVGFKCQDQSSAGVISINESIVDSINNRWGIREHGQRHVRTLAKMMKDQVANNQIPDSSIKWAEGLEY